MNPEEVTQQILGAWDEIVAEEERPPGEPDIEEETPDAEPEPEEEETPAEEPETEEPEEDTEEDEEEAEEEPEEEEEPEQEEPGFETEDLELKAFLAKFQGDPEKALRYGLQSQQALSKLGQERDTLRSRIETLEGELANTRAFNTGPPVLSGEQRQWVDEAMGSGTPAAYVQEALRAGEYGLARAVCTEWGNEQPFEALRAAQIVDQVEAEAYAVQNAPPEYAPLNVETADLVLKEIAKYYPDIEQFAGQMSQVMTQLGDQNQLVVDARSGDPDRTVPALVQILDIAKVSSHSIVSTRERASNGHREEADSARRRAVVASADAAPSPSETPRSVRIGPGLTLEQLDEEWSRNT